MVAGLSTLVLPATAQAQSSQAQSSQVLLGAPKVGRCLDLNRARATRLYVAPRSISCAAPHTLWITAVPVLPRTLPYDFNHAGAMAYASETCSRAAVKALRTTSARYALSSYEGYFFDAPRSARRKGARWFVCAEGKLQGTGFATTTLRRPTTPNLRLPADRFCVRSATKQRTSCSAPHDYVAVATARSRWTDSAKQRRVRAISACAQKVTDPRIFWWAPRVRERGSLLVACLDPVR